MSIVKEFYSIKEIKEKGEFIRKGKIYPARIVKCSRRKLQHCIKAGSNQWAFPTPNGYLIFVENNDGHFECAVRVTVQSASFTGSPYSSGGTSWQGNHGIDDSEALDLFNELYIKFNQ